MELTEFARRAAEDALGTGGDRDDHGVVGVRGARRGGRGAGRGQHADDGHGDAVDVDRLADRVLPGEEFRGGRRTQDGDGRVVRDVLVVDEAAFGHACGRARSATTASCPARVVVAVCAPGREHLGLRGDAGATALMSGASTGEASAATSAVVSVEARTEGPPDAGARRRAARRDGEHVRPERVDLRGHLARGTLAQPDGDDDAGDADQDARARSGTSAGGGCARR